MVVIKNKNIDFGVRSEKFATVSKNNSVREDLPGLRVISKPLVDLGLERSQSTEAQKNRPSTG